MIFVLLVAVFFCGTLTFLTVPVGGEDLQKRQLAHHQLMSQPTDLIIVHTVQLKPMIKAQISERMVSSGISDVAATSAFSEKTHLKKLMMMMMKMIIIITSNRKTIY